MKTSITEEMRFSQKVVEYAIKHKNNAEAARRYKTSRQQVQRWLKKYDVRVESLANKSRRPHRHPNEHIQEELELLKKKYQYHKHEGLGQVYRKCVDAGYKRSYRSMCKQIKKLKDYEKPQKISYPKSKYKPLKGTYPGEFVEIDVKYVPIECIGFKSNYERYYQITAIDLYSRKRILKLVNENSTYETSNMLKTLEKNFGFKIKTVQTDNGKEFCNDREQKKSAFEKVLEYLDIKYIRTRPYSPWQNGKVERSHREDGKILYGRKIFRSEKELKVAVKKHMQRYNSTAKTSLNFKSPNEIVSEYFSKCNICLDN
ncbi:DDE-type integrase/transposase/recombinase [Helcococcus ovis]|uniref:DDE-type integrase/transposase/recombinase n=1 Tax=Helcococcus ovis TaxID=72026 RepID=UPI0038BDBC66